MVDLRPEGIGSYRRMPSINELCLQENGRLSAPDAREVVVLAAETVAAVQSGNDEELGFASRVAEVLKGANPIGGKHVESGSPAGQEKKWPSLAMSALDVGNSTPWLSWRVLWIRRCGIIRV